MDLDNLTETIYEYISILPPHKKIIINEENKFFLLHKLNEFNSETFKDVENTLVYLLKRYGKFIYIKILDNKISNFLPIKNYFWPADIYSDGPDIIKNYNTEKDFLWIKNLLTLLCKKRKLPDVEFFVNYDRKIPMIKKNRRLVDSKSNAADFLLPLKCHTVLSFNTNNNFKDIAIPTETDFNRIKKFSLGIEDFKSMNWLDKENKFFLKKTGDNIEKELLKLDFDINITDEDILISKHKYIIVKDNNGHNEDLSTYFFTGSCVIKIETEWDCWFDKFIKPGIHYIKLNKNLSDLQSTLQWCVDNEEECKKIGLESRKFAIEYLSSNSIFDYFQKQLTDINRIKYNFSINEIQYGHQINYIEEYFDSFLNLPDLNNVLNLKFFNKRSTELNKVLSIICSKNGISQVQHLVIVQNEENVFLGINAAFIGLKVVNQICEEIPNFLYTIYVKSNISINIFYEKIHNLISLDLFLSTNNDKIYEILIQLFLSLQLAYELFCFNHGNLNLENLKIKTVTKPVKIFYRLNSQTFVLETKHILIITDYTNSTVLSNFNFYYKSTRMFIGKKIMDDEKLEENLHVSNNNGNIKSLLKKISHKTNKVFSTPENTKEPYDYMKPIITKEILKDNDIKFGKLSDKIIEEDIPKENVRYVYDKVNMTESPQENVHNRIFTNTIPEEKTAIGNVILNYEISQSIKSVLLDLNMNFNVNINLSKKLKQCLDFISKHYERIIFSTINNTLNTNQDNIVGLESDLYTLKIFLRKYMKVFLTHPLSKKLISSLVDILSSTLNESITTGLKNTIKFYDKYIEVNNTN